MAMTIVPQVGSKRRTFACPTCGAQPHQACHKTIGGTARGGQTYQVPMRTMHAERGRSAGLPQS